MEWVENVNADAKVAYLLTLTEKLMDKIENYKWYHLARKSIDMCWEWVEEKKHSGDELYFRLDNEEGDGLCYIEGVAYIDDVTDPQEETIWFCVTEAVFYATWQAYQYEEVKYVPQAIETVDDELIDEFMKHIRKVDGYQERWAECLKQYLLENYPAGSDRKIKREEMIGLI